VQIEYLVAPQQVLGKSQVEGIELVRMELGEFDAGGRRRPVPVAGSEFVLPVDTVIAAIGQAPDLSYLSPGELETSRRGTLVVNRQLAAARPGVFAGGDVVRGPATVIWAIADGQAAAEGIDRYLCPPLPAEAEAEDEWQEPAPAPAPAPLAEAEEEEAEEKPRVAVPKLEAAKRHCNFLEVELGYTAAMAREEAGRCLRCNRTS